MTNGTFGTCTYPAIKLTYIYYLGIGNDHLTIIIQFYTTLLQTLFKIFYLALEGKFLRLSRLITNKTSLI